MVDFLLDTVYSWPAFGTIFRIAGGYKKFRNTSGYRKAGTSSMKRALKGFLQLVRDFIEASRNSTFDFPHKKTAKNYKYLGSNATLFDF